MVDMLGTAATWFAVLLAVVDAAAQTPAQSACAQLATLLPGSVAQPLSVQYTQDNQHWASSSSDQSTCTVEPATPQDVATILNVITQTRSPWAVKGGGHAYNNGWSSTPGVLVAMTKFNQVTYDSAAGTATIGTANIWDNVYSTLVPQGVNIVGGRVPGVGVAGFTLGGGYSWKTQQHGLTIDTAVAFNLVTPNGTILTATSTSNSDLFFGLRGGGNNFGIVTSFVLKTHAQTEVYGGPLIYLGTPDTVKDAIIAFDAQNTDPKAAILANYVWVAGVVSATVFVFYDAPTPPAGTFDAFLNAGSISSIDVKTRTFDNFVQSLGLSPTPTRIVAQDVPIVRYTKPIVEQIINQTYMLGANLMLLNSGQFMTLSIEPYMSSVYDTSQGGAYPHTSAHPWTPFQPLASWTLSTADATIAAGLKAGTDTIRQVAIQEGQSSQDAIQYNNYAPPGTPLSLLYGDNLSRLSALRAQYDPNNILELTGGWKF